MHGDCILAFRRGFDGDHHATERQVKKTSAVYLEREDGVGCGCLIPEKQLDVRTKARRYNEPRRAAYYN